MFPSQVKHCVSTGSFAQQLEKNLPTLFGSLLKQVLFLIHVRPRAERGALP